MARRASESRTMATEDKPNDVTDAGGLAGGEVEMKEHPDAKADPFADRWRTVREWGADWLTTAPPKRRWLLEAPDGDDQRGWLPLGKVGMLAAGGGFGKTQVLCQLALSVATGRDWLGTFHVAEPGRVLLALGEEDAEEIRRRLYRAADAMKLGARDLEIAADNIVALPLAGTPVALTESDLSGNVTESAVLASLRAKLTDDEWRLVILDPLSRWAGSDTEKDNAAATRFVEAVETLTQAKGGPTVLVSHHTTKAARQEGEGEETAARGASALTDGMRWVATMTRKKMGDLETAVLELKKSNYSMRGNPVDLVTDGEGVFRPMTDAERQLAEAKDREAKAKARKKSPPALPDDDGLN